MNTSVHLRGQVAVGRLATVHRGVRGGRAVAVKRARADVPGAAGALLREARILGAVSHPAVVPLLDVVDDPMAPALVLGWADGGSVADLLADGPLATADLLHLLRPLAGGLDALHRAGVAHLDVSVRNVLLAAAGPVLIDPAPPGAGTPGYADPFVVAGGPPSARSDVYGLAACAHVAITGRLPRSASGLATGLDLPAPVSEALGAALDPDPRCRPASASAFVDRLEVALTVVGHVTAAAAPGRAVARPSHPPAEPPRTWPFDRWHEEATAAEERRALVAAVLTHDAPPSPGRRRRTALVAALVVVTAAAAAGGWLSTRRPHPPLPVRTSAPDSTRRPPAPRPPPTTNPGGRT